ncbi:MAG: hypothetical protein AB1762_12160 [Gemmatimonadota bacterium]
MSSFAVLSRLTALSLVLTVNLGAQRITRRESRGDVHNRVTAATVLTAVDDAARVAARVDRLRQITAAQVRIIDVRPAISGGQRAQYVAALTRRAADIEALRTALVAVDTAIHVLNTQRPPHTVDDVVAAGVLDVIETDKSSTVLVLYVDGQNSVGIAAAGERGSAPFATFRPTVTTLLSAVQMAPEMVARVSAISTLRLDRVKFYDIDAIVKPADVEAYRTAVRQNESAIRLLRAELSKRPLVMHALARHDAKLMLGNIFAADIIGNDDALIIYFKRQAPNDATFFEP